MALERVRESSRCDVAAPQSAFAISGDERERIRLRLQEDLGDECRRLLSQTPATVLLPLPDECARPRVVDDCRARTYESKPAARALRTASDEPRAGRAAALADRRMQTNERVATPPAERRSRTPTDRTALGEKQLEHTAIVRARW